MGEVTILIWVDYLFFKYKKILWEVVEEWWIEKLNNTQWILFALLHSWQYVWKKLVRLDTLNRLEKAYKWKVAIAFFYQILLENVLSQVAVDNVVMQLAIRIQGNFDLIELFQIEAA